jgi:hypothetical protein
LGSVAGDELVLGDGLGLVLGLVDGDVDGLGDDVWPGST